LYAKKDACGQFYYKVGDLDRSDEYFKENPFNQQFKGPNGGDMYRVSYLQSIKPYEPGDYPNVPMFRPYHDE